MKVAVIGDVHVGNHNRFGGSVSRGMNDRCRLVLRSYENAMVSAVNHGAKVIVVLGDLYDSMRPAPQMIDAVRRVHRVALEHDASIVLLKGNHDSDSDYPGDNAVSMMESDHCVVVDVATTIVRNGVGLHCLPFRGGIMTDWIDDVMAKRDIDCDTNLLFCHAGIKSSNTAPWLQDAHDAMTVDEWSKIMDGYAMDLMFAGHWHEYCQHSDTRLFQVGALCPTGFRDVGVNQYGKLMVIDTDTNKVGVHCVPGPRFMDLSERDGCMSDYLQTLPAFHTYFISYTARDSDDAEAATAALRACQYVGNFHIVLDTKQAAADGAEAAAEAAKAVGVDEAVSAYVMSAAPKHMQASVLARVRRYLSAL